MPVPIATLLTPVATSLTISMLRLAQEKGIPLLEKLLSEPGAYLSRVGDLVLWNGEKGSSVVAGLQAVGENQTRILSTVAAIENAQLTTNIALGSIHTLSMASLGIASLTGGMMVWRLQAIQKRLDHIKSILQETHALVRAGIDANLTVAVQKLGAFDNNQDQSEAKDARDKAQYVAAVYGRLASDEAMEKSPKLAALNYATRCYCLALLTEFRARLLLNDTGELANRYMAEKPRLEHIAGVTFTRTIAGKPEAFLAHAMRHHGVTLNLMTELYQHAQRLSAFTETPIRNSTDLFEYVWDRGISGRTFLPWPFGAGPEELAINLKYTMACFEDIGRVEALYLHGQAARNSAVPFKDLQEQVKAAEEKVQTPVESPTITKIPSEEIFAYAMPQPQSQQNARSN
ncbi:hypothetical protein DES53_103198 [Roseimicrobium gellanilyticum]|uniref:Uncharacterized protein n=1 Tax=Roseimicrobium gellanilyticum TaxID=748857 RepID=A0A366HNV7_9BACT|nr:hypothetical protein [Roseimicrobium gellanilyticum]RBP45200.1 hypothetical protein DES53_103198 [Roseimicrobium gellanilyticum]